MVGRRTREGVDGLARVADDAELFAPAEPLVEDELLERGDVLVLVDHEVPVLAADRLGDGVVRGEHVPQHEQDVFEVDDRPLRLDLFVGGDEAGDCAVVEAGGSRPPLRDAGALVVFGRDERDLGPLHLGGQVADGDAVDAEAEPAGGLADCGGLVLEDARRRAADDLRPEEAQLAQRGGVEGPGLDPAHAEVAQPGPHLAGSACCEGHGEDRRRLVHACPDAVGDPVRDGARLAGPRAGEDADRAGQRLGDGSLVRVEGLEDRLGSPRDARDERTGRL